MTLSWRWVILTVVVVIGVVIAGTLSRSFGPEASYQRGRQALIEGDREAVLLESDRLIRNSRDAIKS